MPVHEGPFAPGTPCWADVMVDDLDRARDFYGSLFGWTFEDLPPEAGGYVMARKDGHVVAGAMAKNPDDPGQINAWTVYLATDDVDDTAKRARAAGGVFFLEPTNVLRVARIAVGADPAGAAYGLWQAKEHTGTDLVDAVRRVAPEVPLLTKPFRASALDKAVRDALARRRNAS